LFQVNIVKTDDVFSGETGVVFDKTGVVFRETVDVVSSETVNVVFGETVDVISGETGVVFERSVVSSNTGDVFSAFSTFCR